MCTYYFILSWTGLLCTGDDWAHEEGWVSADPLWQWWCRSGSHHHLSACRMYSVYHCWYSGETELHQKTVSTGTWTVFEETVNLVYTCEHSAKNTRHVQKKTEFLLYRLYCSFYSILSTVPFKAVPTTGDTPFPTFLPLLKCFLEHTFYNGHSSLIKFFWISSMVLNQRPLKVVLSLGNRIKSAGAKSRDGWLGHNGYLILCRLTADEELRVTWHIVMLQHPSVVFTQFRPLPEHSIPQTC